MCDVMDGQFTDSLCVTYGSVSADTAPYDPSSTNEEEEDEDEDEEDDNEEENKNKDENKDGDLTETESDLEGEDATWMKTREPRTIREMKQYVNINPKPDVVKLTDGHLYYYTKADGRTTFANVANDLGYELDFLELIQKCAYLVGYPHTVRPVVFAFTSYDACGRCGAFLVGARRVWQ